MLGIYPKAGKHVFKKKMRKIYSSLSISKSIKNNSNSNQQKNNETVTYL